MHTVVVTMSLDPARGAQVVRHFHDDVVPYATSRPGFVAGQWLRSADGERGMGVMQFESAEAAEDAARGPRTLPRDEARAWNIDSVEMYEEVTRS